MKTNEEIRKELEMKLERVNYWNQHHSIMEKDDDLPIEQSIFGGGL